MNGTTDTTDEGRCCPRIEWDAVGDENDLAAAEDDLAATEDGAK